VPFRRQEPSTSTRGGFTLVELLTALAVVGIAATVLLQLFTGSQSLAKASRTHEIAAGLAEEYLTLLQSRPDLFVWPKYVDQPAGTALPVKVRENGPIAGAFVEPPAALPLARRAHDRERALYSGFTWSATSKLPSQDAAFVEVTVQIDWQLDGRVKQFMLTSAVPRSAGEGVGL